MRAKPPPLSGPPGANHLIVAAREGSVTALGQLLDQCRDYLLLIANQELKSAIRPMVAPSDLVQETFVLAQQHFAAFRGQTEAELIGWLRAMLLNRRLAAYRRFRAAAKRRVKPEALRHDPSMIDDVVRHATIESPSASDIASLAEQAAILEQSLGQLPPDYEQVIRLRYWDRLTFAQIGQRMERSAEAARKLWFRAVEFLGETLENGNGAAG